MNTQYRHILLATDLLPDTLAVAQRARQLAEFYKARLSAIHSVEVAPLYLGDEMMLPETPRIEQQLMTRAEKRMTDLAEEIGISASDCHVEVGGAKAVVLDFVEAHGVDLIIIGRHSHRGLERLLGSTATGVMHGAGCDVLAVHLHE